MKPITYTALAAALALPVMNTDANSLLFYEDFSGFSSASNNTGVPLNGQGGWVSSGSIMNVHNGTIGQDGGSGTWNGTISGSPTAGGNFIAPRFGGTVGYGSIALYPLVTNSFVAGTTTWLSYVEFNGNGGNNGRQNIAIGAAPLTALDANSAAQGIGVATTVNNTPRAAYWDAASGENADAVSSIGSGRPLFVVAKIEWSDAGNDIITVKRWRENDGGIPAGLTEADWDVLTESSSTSADLDQSTFDTLSIVSRYAWFDDIRIASDFDSVVNGTQVVPEPVSGAMVIVGLGALAMRRRRG